MFRNVVRSGAIMSLWPIYKLISRVGICGHQGSLNLIAYMPVLRTIGYIYSVFFRSEETFRWWESLDSQRWRFVVLHNSRLSNGTLVIAWNWECNIGGCWYIWCTCPRMRLLRSCFHAGGSMKSFVSIIPNCGSQVNYTSNKFLCPIWVYRWKPVRLASLPYHVFPNGRSKTA